MGYLTGDSLTSGVVLRMLLFPEDINFWAAVNGAIAELCYAHNWQEYGTVLPTEAAAHFYDIWREFTNMSLCGIIFDFAGSTIPPYCLECDGSTYDRVDYPALYDALDSAFIIDADTFRVPNLVGRVSVGVGEDSNGNVYNMGDTGGETQVTLTSDQMPTHAHDDAGHVHVTPAAVEFLIQEGAGVGAVAVVSTTEVGYANIQTTGNSDPHENMMPFQSVRKIIVAR